MIHEIQNTLWFDTPHGVGQALFIIDYGIHQNTIWVIAITDSREIKHYNSNQIKILNNYTLENENKEKFRNSH